MLAVLGLSSFISCLSGIIVLHFLMSNILKTICIYCVWFVTCFTLFGESGWKSSVLFFFSFVFDLACLVHMALCNHSLIFFPPQILGILHHYFSSLRPAHLLFPLLCHSNYTYKYILLFLSICWVFYSSFCVFLFLLKRNLTYFWKFSPDISSNDWLFF